MTRDWIAAAAGPLAWFASHVASWMLAPPAHDTGDIAPLLAVDAAALAIAIAAGIVAWRRARSLHRPPPVDRRIQRARFVAISGVALAALSVILVLGLTLPIFLLLPGAEP